MDMKKVNRYSFLAGLNIAALCFAADTGLYRINAERNRYYFSKSPVYATREEFGREFQRERTALGLNEQHIDTEFAERPENPDFKAEVRGKNGRYVITINSRYMSRFSLRHELFHLSRHVNGKLHYYPFSVYFEEWAATSYAIDGNRAAD